MFLRKIIEEQHIQHRKPAMVLLTPMFKWKQGPWVDDTPSEPQIIPDEEILKMFSQNLNTQIIIIYGLEPNNNVDAMRSFIFSARKFFDPTVSRPLIMIYTALKFEDLQKANCWSGLYSEIRQYGNAAVKCGYQEGYQTTTHGYFGHQYP